MVQMTSVANNVQMHNTLSSVSGKQNLLGGRFISEDLCPGPFTEGCDGVNDQTLPPWPLKEAVIGMV